MMKAMVVLACLLSLFGCQSSGHGPENDTIISFSLSEGGGMNRFSGFGYYVKETEDGRVLFRFDEGLPGEKEFVIDDHSVFDSLQQIVMKHKVYKYHGHYQPPFDVLDGTSWHLNVDYASGYNISAGGYMHGPQGYGAAFSEICQCLDHWKELPFAPNEVVSFLYVYGKERYTLERKDGHALLTYENEETGVHQEFEREPEMLEDLRVIFNVDRLKMNQTRGRLDEGCTPWMYDIIYSNGDQYRYESYDCDFKCGYTNILQGFLFHWMEENENRKPMYYYYY
ncbi:MAG: hypothetical protein IKT08_01210 [Bacteroidales bacterium]|nr:hypothetical protein [Bacteroidales bacterium]